MADELENGTGDKRDHGRWVVGMLLVVLGVVMLLVQLDLSEAWHLDGLWPVLVIALGLGRFFSGRTDRRPGAGLGMAFAGVLFLLHTQDILRLNDSWPLFIVAGGVSILAGAWDHRGARRREVRHER